MGQTNRISYSNARHFQANRKKMLASKPHSRRGIAMVASAAAVALSYAHSAMATVGTDTWSGATDANFADSNWTGTNNPPTAGDTLDFTSLTGGNTALNDNQSLASIGGINYLSGAAAFTIGGNAITLAGNITNSGSSLQIINDAISLSSGIEVIAGSGNITLGGNLSGSGNLTVQAYSGQLVLSGNNSSYSGTTTINDGTVQVQSNNAFGTGTAIVGYNNGGNGGNVVLDLDGSTLTNAMTLYTYFTGLTLTNSNTGTTANLSGSTLTDDTNWNANGAGNITFGTIFATSAKTVTMTQTGTFTFGGSSDNSFIAGVANSGTDIVNKSNGSAFNALTVAGATVQYGGNTSTSASREINNLTLNSGTVDLNGGSGIGATILSLVGTGGTITNTSATAATLTVNSTSSANAFAGIIQDGTGTTALVETGAGDVLTLTGQNSYSGGTTISAGTLKVGNATALGNTTNNGISIANGAMLDLNGQTIGESIVTVTGTGVSSAGAIINSAASAAAITGTIKGGAGNSFTVGGSGAISLAAVTETNTFTMTDINTNTLTLGGTADNSYLNLTVNTSGGVVILNKSSTNNGHAANNLILTSGTVRYGGNTSTGVFGTGEINGTATVNGGLLDFNGVSGQDGAFQALASSTSTGTITNTSSTAATITIAPNGAGTVTYSGVIQDNSATTTTGVLNVNVSGLAAGGIEVLNGSDTYSGLTTVAGGVNITLVAGSNSALGNSTATTAGLAMTPTGGTATVDFTSAAPAIASLASSGAGTSDVVLGNATGNTSTTLTVGGNNGTTVFGGVISDLSGSATLATGALTKVGTGTLSLNGNDTYTGITTINGGAVSVAFLPAEGSGGGNASGIGTSSNAAANLIINGGTLRYTGATVTTDRSFTVGSGNATLDASGTGAFILTGSATYATANQAQSLTLTGTNTANNTLSAAIGNNGSGAVSVVKNGTGVWVLGASGNTYSGGATINAGTLRTPNSNNNLGSGNVTIATGATLDVFGNTGEVIDNLSGGGNITSTFSANGSGIVLNNSASTAFSGSIFNMNGPGVTKSGVGSLTLSGNSTYSGATTISNGTLQVGAGGTTGSLGTGAVTDNAALIFDRSNNITQGTDFNSAGISGTGSVTQNGANSSALTFNGANTYSGATNILVGSLVLASGGSLGGTAIALSSGTAFIPAAGTTAGTSGNATLNATSATINLPGATGNFSLNQASGFTSTALTLNNTTLNYNLGSTAGSLEDIVLNQGSTSVSGNNVVNLTFATVAGNDTSLTPGNYTLVTSTGVSGNKTGNGTFSFNNLTTAETVTIGTTHYNLSLVDPGPTEYLDVQNASHPIFSLTAASGGAQSNYGGSANVITQGTAAGYEGSFSPNNSNDGKLDVAGAGGSYVAAQVTGINQNAGETTASVEASGFSPSTDTEVFALDVIDNTLGGNITTELNQLVTDITTGGYGTTGLAASTTSPVPDPFGNQYNLFLTINNGAAGANTGSGDNFLGFGVSSANDPNLTDSLSVVDVAAVPEPTSLTVLAIGGFGLMARRRRRNVAK